MGGRRGSEEAWVPFLGDNPDAPRAEAPFIFHERGGGRKLVTEFGQT